MKREQLKHGVTVLTHTSGCKVVMSLARLINSQHKLLCINGKTLADWQRVAWSIVWQRVNDDTSHNLRVDMFDCDELINSAITYDTQHAREDGKVITFWSLLARAIDRQIHHQITRSGDSLDESTAVELTSKQLRENKRILERIKNREDQLLLDRVIESCNRLSSYHRADIADDIGMGKSTLYRRLQEMKERAFPESTAVDESTAVE